MTIICSIILFLRWSFSFLNAIHISKVPGHYINRKIQYSTARKAVYSLYIFFLFMNKFEILHFYNSYKYKEKYNETRTKVVHDNIN